PTPPAYSLSLHDALPISGGARRVGRAPRRQEAPLRLPRQGGAAPGGRGASDRLAAGFEEDADRVRGPPSDPVGHFMEPEPDRRRSEEHTSELQSPCNLVC